MEYGWKDDTERDNEFDNFIEESKKYHKINQDNTLQTILKLEDHVIETKEEIKLLKKQLKDNEEHHEEQLRLFLNNKSKFKSFNEF